jgi:hypothetical protein
MLITHQSASNNFSRSCSPERQYKEKYEYEHRSKEEDPLNLASLLTKMSMDDIYASSENKLDSILEGAEPKGSNLSTSVVVGSESFGKALNIQLDNVEYGLS